VKSKIQLTSLLARGTLPAVDSLTRPLGPRIQCCENRQNWMIEIRTFWEQEDAFFGPMGDGMV
jgi:hypothetical protein